MSAVETEKADFRTTTFKATSDEIAAIDRVKALMQRQTSDSVWRSDVIKAALRRALPEMESEMQSDAASSSQPRGP